MNQSELKKFAQNTRRKLMRQTAVRLDYVLDHDDPYLRSHQKEKKKIEELLTQKGKAQLLEETAYIWFNRLTALRFMDMRGYNRIRVVSPAVGESQPFILTEIKNGRLPSEVQKSSSQIRDYINGRVETPDPDREAYKTALLEWCNHLGSTMPYLFERIDDWAALLLPQDLLSEDSVISDIQKGISVDDCKDVEIIGWLYQYYISEKKDEVFAGLKKNIKIAKENIPAATQLFTPEWIVRYMVENSLGRLWLNNYPESPLRSSMEYFVEADKEKEILNVSDPEEIKVMDPSCGSGHILVYAFDVLFKIYEEEGYTIADIPSLIIKNNLFGVDIDDRAAALASFALAMKARDKDRFFFDKGIVPNVIASGEVDVNLGDVKGIVFSSELQKCFEYLRDAKNLGSLIPVSVAITGEITDLQDKVKGISSDDFFEKDKIEQLTEGLNQLEYLSPRYHCVITNPPYMGGKGMNQKLKDFVGEHYKDTKSDLMTCFMERAETLTLKAGYTAMIDLPSWMFLSSFEKYRENLVKNQTIISLLQIGRGVFGSDFGTVAFIFKNVFEEGFNGLYRRLFTEHVKVDNNSIKEQRFFDKDFGYFRSNQSDFSKIPGSPIAYWFGSAIYQIFQNNDQLSALASVKTGMTTADNNRFVRLWHETSFKLIGISIGNREDALESTNKWFPYNKGGGFRKWFGLNENVINWENDGYEIKSNVDSNGKNKASVRAEKFYFKESISYSAVTSGTFSARLSDCGFLFDSGGSSIFSDNNLGLIISILSTKIPGYFLEAFNDTINFQPGDISRIPIVKADNEEIKNSCVNLARSDWDSFEQSWNFQLFPLISFKNGDKLLKTAYTNLKSYWNQIILKMQRLEEENNRIFIEAYGLEDELDLEVPLNKITLTCNPYYRYGNNKSDPELDNLLLADTIKELISYAVGCSFGRYSLDKDGLILANAEEGFEEYIKQIPKPTFRPDKSGILPITEEDDFTDDITNQFKAFLKASFGSEKFSENLRFVEESIGRDIRSFFLKDFYKDHVKRYKKRPIYWMISSPTGAFRALIYLHRYTKDTISICLNDYLRPYQRKLEGKIQLADQILISASSTNSDKTKAQKDIDKIRKTLKELEVWERAVVYPLATQRIELDLDDGVKVNYGKLGDILETVKGLNG